MNNRSQAGFSFFWFLFFAVIFASIPAGFVAWGWLKVHFVELHAPEIKVLQKPDGVTKEDARLRLALRDKGAGLDEVVVRYYQRGRGHELYRQELNGAFETELNVPLEELQEKLPQGKMDIEIRVFDKSFYSNRGQERLKLLLDNEAPQLKVISTQHNSHLGGSQVVFYRASDKNLSVHGVQVGDRRFFGFSASEIDSDLRDPRLFVALYAIPYGSSRKVPIYLFARDEAGNEQIEKFYHKVLGRTFPNYKRQLPDTLLKQLRQMRGSSAQGLSDEKLFASFLEKEFLTASSEIVKATGTQELKRYFDGYFNKPIGSSRAAFGGTMSYLFSDGTSLDRVLQGYEYIASSNEDVRTVAAGKVIFSKDLPLYGKTLGIDHGLGLFTFYTSLSDTLVDTGDILDTGDRIGSPGESIFNTRRGFGFQVRVQGVPVDAREWWDRGWYAAHVSGKVKDVKKTLGIPYD